MRHHAQMHSLGFDESWQHYGVAHCTRLEQLAVLFVGFLRWKSLCDILSNLTCQSTLKSITIEYELVPYQANNLDEWKLMRVVLAQFPLLSEITFFDRCRSVHSLRYIDAARLELHKHVAVLGRDIKADMCTVCPPDLSDMY